MGHIVRKGQRPAVRLNDRPAEGQAKAQAAAAVASRFVGGEKQFKRAGLPLRRNTGAIIRNTNDCLPSLRPCADLNMRAGRRIFDGVIDQIHQHLNDQPGIHSGQNRRISAIHRNGMLLAPAVDMPQGFRDYVLHDLIGQMKLHASLRDLCDGQQVFHKSVEPLRIVINVGEYLPSGCGIQRFIAVQQRVGVSGNRGQRRAQVVGDGAQQIGAKLLVLYQNSGLLLFSGIAQVVQCQGTFAEDRQRDAGLEGIQRLTGNGDADHAIGLLLGTDGKIQILCSGKLRRRRSGTSPVLPCPLYDLTLLLGRRHAARGRTVGGVKDPRSQLSVFCRIDKNIALQQPLELYRRRLVGILLALRLLQLLICVKQQLRAKSVVGGKLRVCLQLCCQRPCENRRAQHDDKGNGIAGAIGQQREVRFRQKIVEQDHTQNRGQYAAGIAACQSGGEKDAQQVQRNDVGIGKAQTKKQPSDGGGGSQNAQRQQKLTEGRHGRTHQRELFLVVVLINIHVGDDVDVQPRRQLNEPLRQCRTAPEAAALCAAAPDHNPGHAGQPCIFRDLRRHILAAHGDDLRPQLLGKPGILLQPKLVILPHGGVFRCLHIERRKVAAENGRHAPCGTHDPLVGWRGRQADKNMLRCRYFCFLHGLTAFCGHYSTV